ncbi:WD40/YVTN/BNR-like repeat-containing protein [Ralstonia flatus]|nr:YCF48-related protein [Ralstonia sp. LMG 32965]
MPARRLGWFLPLAVACCLGSAKADVLDQPAVASERAATLVQLSVARAGSRLVSVGERGVILLSDDNGHHWRQAKVPVSAALTRVRFVDEKNGWAVGHSGVVLATHDAGESWSKQLDGMRAARLELDAARREDGDASRRAADASRLAEDGADKPFLDVQFSDAQHGMVVGAYGMAFRTEDGGHSWYSVMGHLAAADARHLYAIVKTPDALLLLGEQGTVLASADGGNHFGRVGFPGKGTVFGAVSSASGRILLAYGLKGNVFRSADAGANWERVELPPVSIMAGARLDTGGFLLVDESGQIYLGDNEGRQFHVVQRRAPMTDITLTVDGALVGSSVRGPVRFTAGGDKEVRKL